MRARHRAVDDLDPILHQLAARGGAASEVTPEQLVDAIWRFVSADSEHGRRAQAVVAGLLDVYASPSRVESGRINDPSRKYPGDVCVRSLDDPEVWEKAFEVRDVIEQGDRVALFGSFTYRGRDTGREITSLFSILAKVKNGRVFYIQFLEDTFGTSRTVISPS